MSFVKLATLRDISRSQSISDTSSCASNASECSNLTGSSASSSSDAAIVAPQPTAATSSESSNIKSETASETETSESSGSSSSNNSGSRAAAPNNLLNHHNNCTNDNKINNRNNTDTSSISHNSSIHNNNKHNNSHTNHNNNNNSNNSNNSSAIKKIMANTNASAGNKFLNNNNTAKHNSNTTTVTESSGNSGGESSDPLESDFSENDLEEDIPNVDDIEHDKSDVMKQQLTNNAIDHVGVVDEDDDDDKDYELDDFQIIKTIGTGTFGRVCLCRDKNINKFLAMKILAMADVIRLKQVEHVKNEKNILAEIQHPFIVNLLWFTKDECCLYMLFEYVCGGELFSYLRNAGRFSSPTANFYACEITQALEYLHTLSIVYRDLKPENLLIDRDGHLKITDFGFAKKLKDRTWTLCGTPEYLAPEIIQSKGHNKAVDWWALGVLIYEMLVGYPPFYDDNPFGIYEKILSGKIEWPRHMDPIAKDLVKKLLVQDRTKRLGNMKNGSDDIKRHRWFKHLDWEDVKNKKLRPPIMPRVHFDGDTSNFDEYPETDWKAARSLDSIEIKLFEDF